MIDRIRQTIEYSQLSASAFADTIGISRSGLTHLLTGRNQPSLDVARKILAKFPEISTEWLIMGMGDMLRTDEPDIKQVVAESMPDLTEEHRDENSKFRGQSDLFAEFDNPDDSEQEVEDDVLVNEPLDEVESAEYENDTAIPVVAEPISAPREVPVLTERKPEPLPRPRKPASESRPAPARRERHVPAPAQEKKLQKIVFFYDDHSFEVYNS